MLRQLTLDEVKKYIVDDTVRPHLSAEFRTTGNRQVWGLYEDQYTTEDTPSDEPRAVICVAYCHGVPECEYELDAFSTVDTAPVLEPPMYQPEQSGHVNRFDTLEAALEYAREIQGELEVHASGTITNKFGETMIYDSEGNLAPCMRTSMIQLEQNVATFYTVWSYDRGAGTQLVNELAEWIHENRKDIWRWVTLSPLTEMAEKFHLRNGARFVERYGDCQTFEYTDQVFDLDRRMKEIHEQQEALEREAPALE